MKSTILILISCLLLFACGSKASESDVSNSDSVNSKESTTSANNGQPFRNGKATVNEPSLKNLIRVVDKKGVGIPNEYCALLGIEEGTNYATSMMEVKKLTGDNYLLTLSKHVGTSENFELEEVNLILFNEEGVTSTDNFQISKDSEIAEFSFLHETFFLIDNRISIGFEKDSSEQILRIVFNGKISSIPELSKPELLLCRNLIYARYGYQFKLDSLKKYFSKLDWYKPVSGNVNNQLTNQDKILIEMIMNAETTK